MKQLLFFLSVFIFCQNIQRGASLYSCPWNFSPCTCKELSSKGLDIVCDGVSSLDILDKMKALKDNGGMIYWMKFRNCEVPKLTDFMFKGLEVVHLNIIRSNVNQIEQNVFSGIQSHLTDLDLSSNQISTIPTPSLKNLTKLTFLNLNYNNISRIDEKAFEGLSKLYRLSLYENRISRIHHDSFSGAETLSRINFGKNRLNKIPKDIFHHLAQLTVLNLQENRIENIPNKAFIGLENLETLNLAKNKIYGISENALDGLPKLESLNLENNMIKSIPEKIFIPVKKTLAWIELGNNLFDQIPSKALSPLQKVQQVNFDSNKIKEIFEKDFTGYGEFLKYINLDQNRIDTVTSNSFIDLHNLLWLKLSDNKLTTLPETTIQPVLDTLTNLDISKNQLECSCDLNWLHVWLQEHRDYMSDTIHLCNTADNRAYNIKQWDLNCTTISKDVEEEEATLEEEHFLVNYQGTEELPFDMLDSLKDTLKFLFAFLRQLHRVMKK